MQNEPYKTVRQQEKMKWFKKLQTRKFWQNLIDGADGPKDVFNILCDPHGEGEVDVKCPYCGCEKLSIWIAFGQRSLACFSKKGCGRWWPASQRSRNKQKKKRRK